MSDIRVANAPCSWGSLEFDGMQGEGIGYRQMLDELKGTGYAGTELGDWGYMPTEPLALRQELERRKLALLGAFVPVALKEPEAHSPGKAQALKVAGLLAAASPGSSPFLILADANGTDPVRTRSAGRATEAIGMSPGEWRIFTRGAEEIARAVLDATGLSTLFHHHCAGFIETPQEIERLMDSTNPSLLNLVFDTGHFVFGRGEARLAEDILPWLERFKERIKHVHFKDCHPGVAAQSAARGWDYFQSVREGVFCELGQGCIHFDGVTGWLRGRGYRGWVVVEQDVLPGMGTPEESARRNRDFLRSIGL